MYDPDKVTTLNQINKQEVSIIRTHSEILLKDFVLEFLCAEFGVCTHWNIRVTPESIGLSGRCGVNDVAADIVTDFSFYGIL